VAGTSCLVGNDAPRVDTSFAISKLVNGFVLPAGPIIVVAGESVCGAGIPCLGDVVCDDGGETVLLGVEGEPCLIDDDCDEGGGGTSLLSGKDAWGNESFALRSSVKGVEGEPRLGDDDCDEGGDTTSLLSGKDAWGNESFALRRLVKGFLPPDLLSKEGAAIVFR